ncbi:phage major capsid protein, HK97 family [Rhodococcus rhodochrous ATCC 21198]|uniref:phage major capsid protein n=1 Tax=Rhodococcus aetherivorans TaxID=191292 RepID=UPI0003E1E247|nr:phage major capsid protein [Rhodococcus aetherivorans]ETT25255.1 phage major capsid protein, HK97 family [Rhodococcus rhodochrous ATCC 21198]MDV6295191.1 phage major capsid protein [Rhodococcus aetherivorans]NGP28473.1 phage major capsid protein [Rhodococcus aetherivorans]
MGLTIKELAAQKAKELKAEAKAEADKKSKAAMPAGAPSVTKSKDAKSQEQVGAWYKALADKDRHTMNNINKEIAEDYAKKGQNITTSADGGYLVPTTVADSVLQKRRELSGFRRLATTIENLKGKYDLPTEATKPTAYWVAEGAAITDSKSTFGQKQLVLHKIAGMVNFTYESLQDTATNPSLQKLVEDQLAFVITAEENSAIVNGNGTTQPFGFRSSDITPASVAQVGAGLEYTDITKLRRTLASAYRPFGVFVTSSAGAEALENVRDLQDRPIWREGLAGGNPTTVLTRPIIEMDEIPSNLGAGTDKTEIWFLDPSFYYLGTGEAMRIDWGTNDDDFSRDQIKLRLIDRIGGRPTFGEAFAKLTGVKSS